MKNQRWMESLIILLLEVASSIVGMVVIIVMRLVNIFSRINEKDIIIIRRDRIGDFILWLGCAQKLRNYYSDRRITLICSSYNVAIAQSVQLFDEIICISKPYDILKLRGLTCNLLIDPTQSRCAADVHIANVITCPMKIANNGDDVNLFLLNFRRVQSKTYDKLLVCSQNVVPELVINTNFCNAITHGTDDALYADLSGMIHLPFFDFDYFVVNLGGSSEVKQWPIDRFGDVARRIYEMTKLTCVLIGGGGKEIAASQQFCHLYTGRCINVAGRTSITDAISILAGAKFVLCNDTSTVHICAAADVKCFCIAPSLFNGRFNCYPSSTRVHRKNPPTYITSEPLPCFGCAFDRNLNKRRRICILGQLIPRLSPWPCIDLISPEKAWCIIRKNIEQGSCGCHKDFAN